MRDGSGPGSFGINLGSGGPRAVIVTETNKGSVLVMREGESVGKRKDSRDFVLNNGVAVGRRWGARAGYEWQLECWLCNMM